MINMFICKYSNKLNIKHITINLYLQSFYIHIVRVCVRAHASVYNVMNVLIFLQNKRLNNQPIIYFN